MGQGRIRPDCSGGPRGHTEAITLAQTQHDDVDAEELRLAAVLANEAWKGHPLASEYERLSRGFQKLARRLNKISRISDGFQTQLKHLNTALALASLTDPLTSLANRRAMLERLGQAADAVMKGGPGFAVAMIDIDHFKRINDSFGHALGDVTLRTLSETLEASDGASRRFRGALGWRGIPAVDRAIAGCRDGARAIAKHVRGAVEGVAHRTQRQARRASPSVSALLSTSACCRMKTRSATRIARCMRRSRTGAIPWCAPTICSARGKPLSR